MRLSAKGCVVLSVVREAPITVGYWQTMIHPTANFTDTIVLPARRAAPSAGEAEAVVGPLAPNESAERVEEAVARHIAGGVGALVCATTS